MDINLARKIDEFIGPIICLGLSIARFALARLGFLRRGNPERIDAGATIKKILLIKFYGMGSIILATPVIRAIKKKYPDGKIYFLTFAENEGVCKMIEHIDEIICLNIHSSFIRNVLALLARLWRENFDIVFDFEFFANFTAITTFFTRCSKTVGFHTSKFWTSKFWRNGFYSNTVAFDHSKHVVDIFIKFARVMDINDIDKKLERPRPRDELKRERVLALMKENGIADGDFKVCLNINASSLSYNRRLPKEHYHKILQGLMNLKENVKFILIGGAEDKKYVEAFCSEVDRRERVLNICGELDWDELVALFEVCDLCIGNDSGPLHVAAAVGLPTVSFFGPETPALYGPLEDNHTIFYKDLPCSPCLNVYNAKRDKCKDNRCLKEIDPRQVIDSIKTKYFNLHEI